LNNSAASLLTASSKSGVCKIYNTLSKIDLMASSGLHLSLFSVELESILRLKTPLWSIFGCQIYGSNLITGRLFGKSAGKIILASKGSFSYGE
jgi:hypothetical protein